MSRGIVWLIDDEFEIGELYREELSAYFDYQCFNSATKAFDTIQSYSTNIQNLPDVIICDLSMPDKNGYQIIQEIRKNDWPIEIVIISGNLGYEELQKISELRVCGALEKPFDSKQLFLSVNKAYIASFKTKRFAILDNLWRRRSELQSLLTHNLPPNQLEDILLEYKKVHTELYNLNVTYKP